MENMNSFSHFEVFADDPMRAAKFYEDVFGWKFEKWGQRDYWIITTDNKRDTEMDGGLSKRGGVFGKGGAGSFVCTFEVKDLEEIGEKVKKSGGKWVNDGGLIHGVGYHQYFEDTEGNIFGALQIDKSAVDVP